MTRARRPQGYVEFVTLMALMISLVALSIDAMLPALGQIGADLGVAGANEPQLVISTLFLGLAAAQMVYGPLSDSLGRKPMIYAGFALFIAGTLVCALATSFPVMLAGRVLEGIGAAGPRIVTIALVRDQYAGRDMARIMSVVMAIFIFVPAIAPALGQGMLLVAHWRGIFVAFLVVALVALVWFALRQPETLPPERRAPLSIRQMARGMRETCTHRASLGYTIAGGVVSGAFVGYLNTAAQIFQTQYGLAEWFPLYFAALALAIGLASLLNARLVVRFGMRLLTSRALLVLSGFSLAFLLVALPDGGHPPLWALMVYLGPTLFCIGILFGNLSALAMEPLGHIAGVGAAVVGFLTTVISVVLGTLIGLGYDGTVIPLVAGFAVLGLGAIAVMRWTEHGPT